MHFSWLFRRPWRFTTVSVVIAAMGFLLAWVSPTFAMFLLSGIIMLGAYMFQRAASDLHCHWLAYGEKSAADSQYVSSVITRQF